MKISTKGRYGLRIMLDVAENGAKGPVRIADISARQEISLKYTEQITGALVRSGLLRSVRGAQGGYLLARPAEDYTVWDVVSSLEGDLFPADCVGQDCARAGYCAARDVWVGLYRTIADYLRSRKLVDLLGGADFYQI